jgi:tyrosyl-tRNA synthetase
MRLKSEVLNYLQERGFIKDCTDLSTLDDLCNKQLIALYSGYDLTANSLHAGNLMTLMMLRAFQKYGHTVIALLGGVTTKIGDPTGRDTARPVLTDEQVRINLQGIAGNFEQVFPKPVKVVNNYDWLAGVGYFQFLQEIGTHFTLDRMSAMDSIQLRMGKGITLTELNYMVMQAYDFLHLYKEENCVLQIGGSDQWGNITQGVELIRRTYFAKGVNVQTKAFGLTCPLITRADGSKMGKSADGAVWLAREKLSHFEYFQYFRNIADGDVSKCLRFFTELPIEEVQKLDALQGKEINDAKKILAFEATKIIHGETYALEAQKSAEDIHEHDNKTTNAIEVVTVNSSNILDVLLEVGFVKSKGEAKKLLAQNAVKINDALCVDISSEVQSESILQIGKKRFVKIVR